MDELDQEGSNSQKIAVASAAAGLLGALAMAMTKRKTEDGSSASENGAGKTGDTGFQQVVDQVAEVAPGVVAALDQHAPDVARRLRSKLPMVRAFGGGVVADAVEFGPTPRRQGGKLGVQATNAPAEDQIVEKMQDVQAKGDRAVGDIDFSTLSAVQAAAARAAIAAVSKAETAFGDGGRPAGAAARSGAESGTSVLRDVAQQGAMLALDLWQNARNKSDSAVQEMTEARNEAAEFTQAAIEQARKEAGEARAEAAAAREAAEEALRKLRAIAAEEVAAAREKAADVIEDVAEFREEVEDQIAAAEPEAVKERKRTGAGTKFMWAAALLGTTFYVLMDEERRRESTLQVRELLRDLRGYDDEF